MYFCWYTYYKSTHLIGWATNIWHVNPIATDHLLKGDSYEGAEFPVAVSLNVLKVTIPYNGFQLHIC